MYPGAALLIKFKIAEVKIKDHSTFRSSVKESFDETISSEESRDSVIKNEYKIKTQYMETKFKFKI
jgi:hypothetical protein